MDFQHPYEARHQTRRLARKTAALQGAYSEHQRQARRNNHAAHTGAYQAKTNQRNAGILPLKGIKQRKKPLPPLGFRHQVRQNFKKKKIKSVAFYLEFPIFR